MITSLESRDLDRVLEATPTQITTPSGVTIRTPYPSPADWRDKWIYFILIDRFNNPKEKPKNNIEEYQGGTFEGIRQQLPYLKDMGVGAIWLSPVLMNPQWASKFWGGYCIMDFLHIEPRYCSDPTQALKNPDVGDEEFKMLVAEAHAHGIHVILDIVLNHTADLFNYEGVRDAAPWNNEREYGVYWRDDHGTPHANYTDIQLIPNLQKTHTEGIWPTEFQRNDYFRRRGDVETSPNMLVGDFGTLKEIVTEYRVPTTGLYPVRDALIRVYEYLIGKFDIDGYRIDTLQYIEPEFARNFGNAMREYALSIGKANFFTFGEIWQDNDENKFAQYVGRNTSTEGETVGVDATIDFPIRKRLVDFAKGTGTPREIADHFAYRKTALQNTVSSHGEASRYFVTFLDNHDMNERFNYPGYENQTKLALTCLMTLQGIPCIYYGTEQGLSGRGNRREFVREPLWGQTRPFDAKHEFYELIRDLNELRIQNPALRYGRQYFRKISGNGVDFDYSNDRGGILAYSRLLSNREVLVVANVSTTQTTTVHVVVDHNLTPVGAKWDVIYSTRTKKPTPVTATTCGVYTTVPVTLMPMETQILRMAEAG